MITINLDTIKVKTLENESGIFIGNNNAQNWSHISKQNTNVSGNHVSNNKNIVFDQDDVDYVVTENKNVSQSGTGKSDNVLINQKKTGNMQKKKTKQRRMKSEKMLKRTKKNTKMKNHSCHK